MFDRVVFALVAVVLLLFSATAALACSGCDRGTAQCLVSLEAQAGEVLSTDLEVVSSLDLNLQAEPFEAQDDRNTMAISDRTDRHAIARSAAGVNDTDVAQRDSLEAPNTMGRHGVGVRVGA